MIFIISNSSVLLLLLLIKPGNKEGREKYLFYFWHSRGGICILPYAYNACTMYVYICIYKIQCNLRLKKTSYVYDGATYDLRF